MRGGAVGAVRRRVVAGGWWWWWWTLGHAAPSARCRVAPRADADPGAQASDGRRAAATKMSQNAPCTHVGGDPHAAARVRLQRTRAWPAGSAPRPSDRPAPPHLALLRVVQAPRPVDGHVSHAVVELYGGAHRAASVDLSPSWGRVRVAGGGGTCISALPPGTPGLGRAPRPTPVVTDPSCCRHSGALHQERRARERLAVRVGAPSAPTRTRLHRRQARSAVVREGCRS